MKRAFVAVLFLALCALSGIAHAQEEPPVPSVGGTITAPPDEEGNRAPLEGVGFTVAQGGEEIGEDETGADGTWRVAVPAAGVYQVTIDPETIPEGFGLRDPDRATLDRVDVRADQAKIVLFPIVEGEGGGGSGRSLADRLDRIADLAANGIKVGAIIALAAIGLSLIFGVTGLVNFAHGELVTLGAIATWYANDAGLNIWLAGLVGIAFGALVGYASERGLFRPLRKRRMGSVALMVVTIGLSQFLRHIILLVFGGAPNPYDAYRSQRAVEIGPISMLPKDIFITVFALLVLLLVGYLLRATKLGTAMRAVSDNRDLAESSGIDVQRIILITWVAGAALAALGGILYGTSQTVAWDMGFALLLLMFAAVVLGGLGSAYGAMVGGLVIGLASEISTYWLETEFKYVTGLAVLVVVLLFRPQGILGIKERVG